MNKFIVTTLLVILSTVSIITTTKFLNQENPSQTYLRKTTDVLTAWNTWKQKFNKQYLLSEEPLRFKIFTQNYNVVQKHNADKSKSYTLGLTVFADLSQTEFSSLQKAQFPKQAQQINPKITFDVNSSLLGASLDWRSQNVVTSIKNQGQCGSCWAFSSSAALEGLAAIQGKGLQDFSPQQLVDCNTAGSSGCNGGNYEAAFDYVRGNGIKTWNNYPYVGAQQTCQCSAAPCPGYAFMNSYYDQISADPTSLGNAVNSGPVSVGIEADQQVFQLYSGGIFNDVGCGTNMDHAVLVVGYNTDQNPSYWIVKNSWGTGWGESGYIQIQIAGGAGICGINQFPVRPT